jgi:hypothetical protein
MIESTRKLEAAETEIAILPSDAGSHSPRVRNSTWWALIGLSVAADFLMLPLVRVFDQGPTLPQAIIVLGSLGSTLAQGSLLAAWLVWSDAPFSRRLLWHWIVAGCLCCIWLIGLALAAPPHSFLEIGFTVALTVPLVSLGAQLPFWIVRIFFGWRLVRITAPPAAAPFAEQPLSIRDLLLATLIVGVSFAVARLSPAAQQEEEFRVAWGVFMAAAATICTIAILPAAAMLLRPRPFARAVKYSLAYASVPIILLWGTVAVVRFYGLTNKLPPWFMFVGMTCLILAYAGTAIFAAAVARDHGYLLAWGRKPATFRAALPIQPGAAGPPAVTGDANR